MVGHKGIDGQLMAVAHHRPDDDDDDDDACSKYHRDSTVEAKVSIRLAGTTCVPYPNNKV